MADTKATGAAAKAVPAKTTHLKAAELAEMLDLSVARIGQLRKEGVLRQEHTPLGDRYPLIDSVRSYVRFIRDAKSTQGSSEERRDAAEADLKEAKAAIAELELKEILGQMHRAEDVEAMTSDLVLAVRTLLMALPGRLAVDIMQAGTSAEASVIIRSEVNRILEELSAYRYDPDAYARRLQERGGLTAAEDVEDDED